MQNQNTDSYTQLAIDFIQQGANWIYNKMHNIIPQKTEQLSFDKIENLIDINQIKQTLNKEQLKTKKHEPINNDQLIQLYKKCNNLADFGTDTKQQQKYKKRANALEQTIDNPDLYMEKDLLLSLKAQKMIIENNLAPYLFSSVAGTPAQIVAYDECVQYLNSMAHLCSRNEDIKHLPSLSKHIVSFADASYSSTKLNSIKQSFNINDFCFTLLKCAKGLVVGAYKGTKAAINQFIHPIDTIQDYLNGICYLSQGFIKLLSCINLDYNFLSIYPEPIVISLDEKNTQDVKNYSNAFYQTIKQKWKSSTAPEITEAVSANITEQIVFFKLLSSIKNFAKIGCKQIQNVQKAMAAKSPAEAVFLVSPEGIAFEQSTMHLMEKIPQKNKCKFKPFNESELQKNVFKKVGNTIIPKKCGPLPEKIVKMRKAEFAAILEEGLKETPVPKELQKIFKSWKGFDIEHIVKGEINKRTKKPSGLHVLFCHPERFIETTKIYEKQGFFQGRWGLEVGKTKKSTFLPFQWGHKETAYEILEATKNPVDHFIEDTGIRLFGKTTEEINLQFWIEFDGSIRSTFPVNKIQIK